ncbi:hypothetical protein FB451DRAFT_1551099 [Mycena latifolia]|nr:hypothetical protein FB451DRAFT_1551099 [Mycena latifolia]
MALSRLDYMPPELKMVTYYHFDHRDLLSVSHVSKFWRSLALRDKRWATWFELIVDPESESNKSAREYLESLKVLDIIPARTIVTLCFSTKCALCSKDTTYIFLPLLKRICHDCLRSEDHAVIALSAALATYDLSEKDIKGLVILHWEETKPDQSKKSGFMTRVKLVSASAVKSVAIKKYGGEEKLATRLQSKKARLLKAYEKRLAEYNVANAERTKLKAAGDVEGAAAVTWKNNKKVPKTRPKMPIILKDSPSCLGQFYEAVSILPTNFLTLEAGYMVARKLLKCKICIILANLRSEYEGGSAPRYPGWMQPSLLADHQEMEHYARPGCYEGCSDGDFPCDECLNTSAIAINEEIDDYL